MSLEGPSGLPCFWDNAVCKPLKSVLSSLSHFSLSRELLALAVPNDPVGFSSHSAAHFELPNSCWVQVNSVSRQRAYQPAFLKSWLMLEPLWRARFPKWQERKILEQMVIEMVYQLPDRKE